MNDKQLELAMQIVKEQLGDWMGPMVLDQACDGIREGLFDNLELFEKLGGEDE